MALSDFTPERIEVKYKGKTLVTVRGLNGNDFSLIVRQHLDDLRQVFKIVTADGQKLLPSSPEIENAIFIVVTKLPDLTARIIALAADEPAGEDYAKRLPMPLQVSIVHDIVKMTFEDVGGPLAFAGIVRGMLSAGPEQPIRGTYGDATIPHAIPH